MAGQFVDQKPRPPLGDPSSQRREESRIRPPLRVIVKSTLFGMCPGPGAETGKQVPPLPDSTLGRRGAAGTSRVVFVVTPALRPAQLGIRCRDEVVRGCALDPRDVAPFRPSRFPRS